MIRQKILYGNGEVNLIGEESKGIEINFKGKEHSIYDLESFDFSNVKIAVVKALV